MKYPSFIEPFDIDKMRDEIIEDFKVKSGKLDYIPVISDDYITLIDSFLYKMTNVIEQINYVISNNYIDYSSGEFLDELVSLIGIKRKLGAKPIATLKITANSPTFLAKGTKFTDTKGHNAYLLMDYEIKDETLVKVELDDYSSEQYETNTLEVPNIYIKDIDIVVPFSGCEEIESDDELRDRFKLALHAFSTAGAKGAYFFHALSVEGIKKVNVYNDGPGRVKVIYQSNLDPDVAKAKLAQALDDENRPLTDLVEFEEAKEIVYDLEIFIDIKDEYLFSQNITQVDSFIKEYFSKLNIGQGVHKSKIIELAFAQSSNITKVEISPDPPEILKNEILILNSLAIKKFENDWFKSLRWYSF